MDKKVLIRIYDTKNKHLEDIKLPRQEAIYLSPGGYLSDYEWAQDLKITHPRVRMVRSVGSKSEDFQDLKSNKDANPNSSSENQKNVFTVSPFLSIWVDSYDH
jgi:hypothetical protein